MNTNGWDQLNCQFFTQICRRVLGNYLQQQGFLEKKTTAIGGIVYTRFDVFLEVSYDAATCPDYSPSIVIGIGDQTYDKEGRLAGVPMWYALSEGHPQRTRRYWTFKTEEELERVFTEIKEQFFETSAKQLWLNSDVLEKTINDFRTKF